MTDIFAGLNPEQTEAVRNYKDPLLVMAPIGTGKTKVIAHRTAYACMQGISHSEILCLSFTNKAAREMKDRITAFGFHNSHKIKISTFHSFCDYILRIEADRLGIDSDFLIYDEEDSLEVMVSLKKKFPSLHLPAKEREIPGLIEYIKMRDYKATNSDYETKLRQPDLLKYAAAYDEFLSSNHAMDFNDLILNVIRLFKTDREVLEKWQSQYKWIQVDEFQDINLAEYTIIRSLSARTRDIAFFGDLDQTIYEWRGSLHTRIADIICEDFKPVKNIPFFRNYRSTRNILFGANTFIRQYSGSVTKKVQACIAKDGEKIGIHTENCIEDEGRWIAHKINDIKNAWRLNYSDFAVLTRDNRTAVAISEQFTASSLPHYIIEEFKFFRRAEIKDAMAHLKFLLNRYDLKSFRRLLQRPNKGIGDKTIENIMSLDPEIGLKLIDFSDASLYETADPFGSLIRAYNDGNLVVFDTETTGLDISSDEIIEIAAVRIKSGKITGRFHDYIKPSFSVGTSEKIHGLSDVFLNKNGKDASAVLNEFMEFINGTVIAGHNVNYDISILCNVSGRLGLKKPEYKKYYDTLDMSRRFYRLEDYSLAFLARKLDIPDLPTHRAMDDVIATCRLLTLLIQEAEVKRSIRQKEVLKYYEQFKSVAGQIDAWRADMHILRPQHLLNKIINESQLRDFTKKLPNGEKRLGNIDELLSIFNELDDTTLPPAESLRKIITISALGDDRERIVQKENKSVIITAHQAKGLEFDTVFIAGATDSCFPSYFSRIANKFDEEHRLFYVAMTRARNRLFITSHKYTWNRQDYSSRFTRIIPGQFKEEI